MTETNPLTLTDAQVRGVLARASAFLDGLAHPRTCTGDGCSCGLEQLRADVPLLAREVLAARESLRQVMVQLQEPARG